MPQGEVSIPNAPFSACNGSKPWRAVYADGRHRQHQMVDLINLDVEAAVQLRVYIVNLIRHRLDRLLETGKGFAADVSAS